MDIVPCNDSTISLKFLSAEMCEYLPKGEGWQYTKKAVLLMMETVRSIQMVAVASMVMQQVPSGLHDVYEAVHQMRGDAGATQFIMM